MVPRSAEAADRTRLLFADRDLPFGPTTPQSGTRAGVRLTAIGKVVRRASPGGGFRGRPGHTPLDLLFLNPISRFGDGPRGTVGPQGRDSRRRGRCDADDPQDRSGELLAPRPCPARRATSTSRPSGSGRGGAAASPSSNCGARTSASSSTGSTSKPSRMRGRTRAARPTRPASTSAPYSTGPGSRS